jgi:F-type H+-transporting ATPase subunit delta
MEELAQVYARALLEAALDEGKLEILHEQLVQLADAIEANRQLAIFFFSPYFTTEEKKQGLDRVVQDADPTLLNFVRVLIENHRMPVLFRARQEFQRLWEEQNRMLPVEITSAVELDAKTTERLGETIGERTGRRVQLAARIDPEIIGGVILRVGNSILDASIRNRLENLRKQVARA